MQVSLDLSARWEGFSLAARADLELDGVTALFGPSGAGKSTVLSAIAGFRPGLGSVAVDGTVWQKGRTMQPAHRRPVGLVFQDGRLFDHLSVGGNLAYAARRGDPEGPPISEPDVVAALGLGDMLARRPASLSGGERQRVAMARALLTRPRLMLMDEPLAALDRVRKAAILPLIAALPEQFGMPVLLVSHQLDEIVQIADRIVAMHAGAITGQGPVTEMIAALDPAVSGRFEASAVVSGQISEIDERFAMFAVDIGGHILWVPDVTGATLGEEVRLRLRARDVSLALAPAEGLSIRNQLPATITGIETDEGPIAEVQLDCDGFVLRARVTRMALADLDLAPGRPVWALVKSIAFDRRLSRG